MKSGHKLLGGLLILIGLLINPVSLSWLFSNDENITSWSLIAAIISIGFIIVLLGVAVYSFPKNVWLSKVGLALVSTVFTITLLISADRFYGALLMPETSQLLFPAYSRAEHNTAEFELDVQINNLGFRGENTSIKKKKKRVLVIGDSFTFGWGVTLEETWVELLGNNYTHVEFLNLGQGGNHPGDYVQVAKKAIPLLKPDVVIVCILDGNDIHQLMRVVEYERGPKVEDEIIFLDEPRNENLKRYLHVLLPHFSVRFQRSNSIQKRWLKDSRNLSWGLSTEQDAKYELLDANIRNEFEHGRLNPSLIYEGLHHPNLFIDATDTSNTLCKKAIIRLQDHLEEIRALADAVEAKTIMVSLPNRPYGFKTELNQLTELGFNVAGCDTLTGNIPTQLALSQTKTTTIYPSIIGDSLFYKYDGHWNANGNRIFAQELIKELDNLPEWKRFLTSSSF
jgi:hypothetical protein